MAQSRVLIINTFIDNLSKEKLLQKVYEKIEDQRKNVFIVTANPEIVMTAHKSESYSASLSKADFIIPDGFGVMLASKILKRPLEEKIVGYELLHTFLDHASSHGKSVYFFGSQKGIADLAAKNALSLYPHLIIAGLKDGYSGQGDDTAKEIAETRPDFLFIGLGVPLQENWAAKYKHLFSSTVMMGVGGSFDVLSGHVKRAPRLWLKYNLEWFYRLLSQPTRIKRMIQLPIFMLTVFKQKKTDPARLPKHKRIT
ncbi:WecB/TagA/CpsF family glycosyltransferase [Planococcus glaciei]|uniref:WecB/TagA/CpsF family glycosyltransferase n=1 Tax=Planococcus glaciei TaxID=459472 RepID=UPI001C734854|nr:WecB/TagA/CpsF family glycosyltransferase [Planococcus glaciei]MBX0313385.1 WecB/TagA/CpsF family glycosyltransferase [Planococcus glaciei]